MIREGEWNINEFPELKKDLLNKLNIQAVDETSLPQLLEEVLEEVQSIRENSLHQLLEEIQKIQPKS
ncbi:uncharacterized protein OCT59_007744 [Rhizophagus irregularis]|uniref:Uncharacterized protein n=1 Tax=Rhizophagus irregularis (strain DAOM 197198w) TaxID=1432141 RepID=A0A015KJC3_RHIIW|nr:hypothetical protein RirG_186030 [Rhizophagus irregularis DAOM 197198w]UZO16355.1 hypothetical protein OCT59_007744 [Rhizophagus irregularis]GBC33623.1 hypothetical protein GLOIN_2v1768236 [Rhizophagus irregularis DAOM 181602=DAOM 197198]